MSIEDHITEHNAEIAAAPKPKRSRKAKPAAAELPVVTESTAPAKPKRASRSKAAVAEREAAVVADAKATLASTPENDPAFLADIELKDAVAALDDHDDAEVVRSLADIDVDFDYQFGVEEAALARFNKKHGNEFMAGTATQVLRPPLYDVIRDVVDILIVTGQWVPPAGEETEILKYWPQIKQRLLDVLSSPDALTGSDAIRLRLDAAKLAIAEREEAARTGDGMAIQEAINAAVHDLEGQLRDEQAARARDVAAMRVDLDAADIKLAQSEAVTQATLEDLKAKVTVIEHLEAKLAAGHNTVSVLQDDLDRANATVRHFRKIAETLSNRGFWARLLNRKPVLPLSEPMKLDPNVLTRKRNSRSTTVS